MTVDKYILLRSEDYDRLMTEQINSNPHIDSKTLYHSNQKGLTEDKPSQQISPISKTSNNKGIISGGGEKQNLQEHQNTSQGGSSTISKAELHWFDVWEGLYFAK